MTVKRITFLQELLDFMGLGGRLHLAWISSAEAQRFVQVVSEFTEKIRKLGPNPLPAFSGNQDRVGWPLGQASENHLPGLNPAAITLDPEAERITGE